MTSAGVGFTVLDAVLATFRKAAENDKDDIVSPPAMRQRPNKRLKLTGAACKDVEARKTRMAAPAAYPFR